MEITNNSFVEMSLSYARSYQENPKAFLNCYRKHKSVRMACKWIVVTYKYIGAFDEVKAIGKDFTKWVDKQEIEDKDKKTFNEILMIIYSITKQ